MIRARPIVLLLAGLALLACERQLPFAKYQQELFTVTPITGSQTRVIKLVNAETEVPQHIRAVGYDGGGNPGEHFTIEEVRVADKVVPKHDISVPPGAALELHIRYAPRNLETTQADFGGVESGAPERITPQAPPEEADDASTVTSAARGAVRVAGMLMGSKAATDAPETVHRALLVLTYDYPQEGVLQLELTGSAIPGPNGELTATGGVADDGPVVSGECTAGGTTACLSGTFSIHLPGLMQQAVETELAGAWPISIDGGIATAAMSQFPIALFNVHGNGLGEPLEGQPISAIAIALSGDPKSTTTGSFDGSALTLPDASFRIRIYFSAVTLGSLGTSAAPVDFLVSGLTLETLEPLTDGHITLGVEAVLGPNPTGNPIADPLLSGATVIVQIKGMLVLP